MMNEPTRTALTVIVVLSLGPGVVAGQVEEEYEPGGLPGPLQSLIAGENIVIYVTNGSSSWDARTADDTMTYSLKTDESARITSFNRTVFEDKTFEILVERSVLNEAVKADSAQARLVDAYQAGSIKYRGVGFWNAALTTATKTATSTAAGIYTGVTSVASWAS